MSDLDDALNTSTPLFHPATIDAQWQELPPGYSATGLDSIRDLGQQIGPSGFSVEHGFDDGLPDPVTMTAMNDSAGSMGAELIGRPANVADTYGLRTPGGGTAVASEYEIPNPVDVQPGDYVLCAVSFNTVVTIVDTKADPENRHGWTRLAEVTDGTLTTSVWGRRYYAGASGFALKLGAATPSSWVTVPVWAATAAGTVVYVAPGTPVTAAEAVTGTSHTLPAQNLNGRGWTFGFWSTVSGTSLWTVPAPDVEIVEAASVVDLMASRSLIQLSADPAKVMTATTSSSTGAGAFVGVPMTFLDRPQMDARRYFSPFEARSPVYGFDRDTAALTTAVNVVSPNGIVETPIFKGQMADLAISGDTADLFGVSRTRILLDKALTVPRVFGRREGATIDWLTGYAAAQGGQYFGVAPSPKTRCWIPMNGSVHPYMDGPLGYNTAYRFSSASSPVGPYAKDYPNTVPGPFEGTRGMFAQYTDSSIIQLAARPDRYLPTDVPGQDVPQSYDLLSQANNEGRLTFWLRGDPASSTDSPASTSTNRWLFRFILYNDLTPGFGGYVACQVNQNRSMTIWLSNSLALTGGDLPTDGAWHFFGFTWNYAAGTANFRRDNLTWTLTGFASSSDTLLPVTDAAFFSDPTNSRWHTYQSQLPVAEVQLETGPGLMTEGFTRFYPTPLAPSQNAITRPTDVPLEAISELVPIQGWSLLQELAKSTVSALRVNEDDNLEFLPQTYFGEDEQLTPQLISLDTDVNASELEVKLDPTKTRNTVTVAFDETRVDSKRVAVMELRETLTIPPGLMTVTFALDLPVAEIHGALEPYTNPDWNIEKLGILQINGTNPIPNSHYMTANLRQDPNDGIGGSLPWESTSLNARILTYDASTVTIRFSNTARLNVYLANTGENVPVLRILGYPIRRAKAYSTLTDKGSIKYRRERALTHESPWIMDRTSGQNLANRLLSTLAVPRPEIKVRVMGDPRRRPGQLITLADSEGTAAAGTWRIMSIIHDGKGAQYTQDLQLVYVQPVGYWDTTNWDQVVWSE